MSYPSITSRPTQGTGITVSGSTVSLDQTYTDTRYVNVPGDTMTGPLIIITGVVGTPGLSFSGNTNTGIYQSAANQIDFSTAGVARCSILNNRISTTIPIYAPVGSVGAPSYTFQGNANTGILQGTGDDVSISSGGTLTLSSRPSRVYFGVQIHSQDGNANTPGYAFGNAQDTGMFNSGGILSFSTLGTQRLSISSTSITSTAPYIAPAGSISSPSYSFTNSPNSGLYAVTSTVLGLSVASTINALFTASSTLTLVPISLGTASSVSSCALQMYGTAGTGIYSAGTHILGFSANSVSQLTISSTSASFTNIIIAPTIQTTNSIVTNLAYMSNGSNTSPSLTFINDTDVGLYIPSPGVNANTLGIATGGIGRMFVGASSVSITNKLLVPNGSVSAPSISFTNDSDTGFYTASNNSNEIIATCGGAISLRITSSQNSFVASGTTVAILDTTGLVISTTKKIYAPNDIGRSCYTFSGSSSDTGMGLIGTHQLGFWAGGVNSFNISSTFIDCAGLPIFVGTPTSSSHAATKAYVDSIATGLTVKNSVRAATTANITLSGTQTIDGVAVIAGDRVLVKNQSTASANGIYDVAAGAWTRSLDADVSAEVTSGMYCLVTSGTTNGGEGWILTTSNPITLGTTSLTFAQFSSTTSYTQGTGITISGNTIALDATYTDSRYLTLSGGTMTGSVSMGSNVLVLGYTPASNFEAANKLYVDTKLSLTGGTLSGSLSMGGNTITNVGTPSATSDAANKTYVDTAVATKLSRSDLKLVPFSGDADITISDTHDSGLITHTDGVVRSYTMGIGGSIGLTTTICNNGTSVVTLVQGASTTLKQTGTSNTGTRTLAVNGMATAVKVSANTWFISGGVLT